MRNSRLFFGSIFFISGIILASLSVFSAIPPNLLFLTAAIFLASLIIFRKKDFLFVTLLSLLLLLLGVVRYNIFNEVGDDNLKNYTSFRQEKLILMGNVASDPEKSRSGKKKSFVLEAKIIQEPSGPRKTSGFGLVNAYGEGREFEYGDMVILECFLKRPAFYYNEKQNFDYKRYLGNKRIYSILNVKKEFFVKKIGKEKGIPARFVRKILSLRHKLGSHIEKYLEPPESAILSAVLLGKRRGIPPGLKDLFVKTGTLHILAISGLHVGIIYFALRLILNILRVPPKVAVILSVLFLAAFTILTGARPSILRSATMFSILAFSELLKRKTGTFGLIGLSAFIILMANPNQVFNAGFILSFVAVLSIVVISPYVRLFRPVSISLAAYLGLMPLLAYYFGLISPVVIIANLVVVPLLFLIMGSGLLFITLGFLSEFLAVAFGESAWVLLLLLENSVKVLKKLPFSYFEIDPPRLWMVIAYYIVLCVAIAAFRRVKTIV